MIVARSCYDGVAIHYVFPVWWIVMFFYTVGSVLRRVHYNVLVYIVVKLFHFVFFLLFLYLCLFCVFLSTIMMNKDVYIREATRAYQPNYCINCNLQPNLAQ